IVVGVNKFTEGEASPLLQGADSILSVDESMGREQIQRLRAHRAQRNKAEVEAALRGLHEAIATGANVMEPSVRCAHAGVTTGEWADALRAVYGEYRAPTGVDTAVAPRSDAVQIAELRKRVDEVSAVLGRRLKLLVGKPGLDGHSSGAEQIAIFARDAGLEVVYQGIRMTPDEIVNAALQEGVHLIGLSILSGSHLVLAPEIARRSRVPVIVGGIIPDEDAAKLIADGVSAVYTPRDYDVLRILREMVEIAAAAHGAG
ncbi:MAG: methylmalonyl-CoA mutase family protein, partial [Solirubrobacteraceae bacterium]